MDRKVVSRGREFRDRYTLENRGGFKKGTDTVVRVQKGRQNRKVETKEKVEKVRGRNYNERERESM